MPASTDVARRNNDTSDATIRQVLRTQLEQEHRGVAGTRIVEELGLHQGACRVDVAVVNGSLEGFEIKSDRDGLGRYKSQVTAYSSVLDHASVVCGDRHLRRVLEATPSWWGVRVATVGSGAAEIHELRSPDTNPCVDPTALVQLLWRDEALAILTELGLSKGLVSKPKRQLWNVLVKQLPVLTLAAYVRENIRARRDWRN